MNNKLFFLTVSHVFSILEKLYNKKTVDIYVMTIICVQLFFLITKLSE